MVYSKEKLLSIRDSYSVEYWKSYALLLSDHKVIASASSPVGT